MGNRRLGLNFVGFEGFGLELPYLLSKRKIFYLFEFQLVKYPLVRVTTEDMNSVVGDQNTHII